MNRVKFFRLMVLGMAGVVCSSGEASGDEEWDRKFRALVRAFNLFVLDYNDGKFDRKKWGQVVEAFDDIAPGKSRK